MTTVGSDRESELAASLAAVRDRLERAAQVAGRDAGDITLLPVTKFFPASDVRILYGLGCRDFAESREQEASAKAAELADEFAGDPPRWHMVGRIQRNKARAVTRWAHSAHSVDSAKLVNALDRGAADALADGLRSAPLRVYLQLSLDGDVARGGIDVGQSAQVDELCAAVDSAEALEFVGLMAIPPLGADPPSAFARLRAELERVQSHYQQRLEMSAGMSGDLETAVQHGSTCVRVGTALMGPRPLTSP
ncbi:YggS family pyridoxal phosphate-dependent enzyme [Mycobacterium sp. GA-2829]|uniref:YggS family pyridoxal phosphate-dependent enzyme n=1 Tax=Mycobacterium sp. GA-2829 TaxID=1772283 RepID=UPI0007403B07|nr:YggS family pyridoxal phosphate-dependent enzyme [Mycobacterium sp. GA-2829]KUI40175.1 YggS family pyridoxal phosphate enzyme [Mycobacterium sp. GA-2829]